jgi:hypothetical protein
MPHVKGVGAQDSGASTTEFVASTDNGVGIFARQPDGEGGEIWEAKEGNETNNSCLLYSITCQHYIAWFPNKQSRSCGGAEGAAAPGPQNQRAP